MRSFPAETGVASKLTLSALVTAGQEGQRRGAITFTFTVTEQGLVDGLRIKEQDLNRNSLPTPIVQAFREARYRPRVVDGKPVATADQESRFSVGIDRRSESYGR